MIKWRLLILFLLPGLLVSCLIDTKPVEQNGDKSISVLRYDRLQSEYVRFSSISALQRMNIQYPRPTQILIEDILGLGQVSDDNINQRLLEFYSDAALLKLMEDVEEHFQDLDKHEKELNSGFRKLKKEVPTLEIPKIYTQISALNESIIVVDSLLGISLDKYMGDDYPLYQRYYYEYQRRSMRPDRIAPDCFAFYLLANYSIPETSRRTLLDVMIHYGKIHYVTQQLLGYSSVEDIMGYSDEEKAWCKNNKKRVWEYLLSGRQLSSTDPMLIRRYIWPMPYITFFGENSPALIGTWMGLEIVTSYMKYNKVSIKQLLETTDYEMLLTESRFNP